MSTPPDALLSSEAKEVLRGFAQRNLGRKRLAFAAALAATDGAAGRPATSTSPFTYNRMGSSSGRVSTSCTPFW